MKLFKNLSLLAFLLLMTSCLPPKYVDGKDARTLTNTFSAGDKYETRVDYVLGQTYDGLDYYLKEKTAYLDTEYLEYTPIPIGSRFEIVRIYRAFSGTFGYLQGGELR